MNDYGSIQEMVYTELREKILELVYAPGMAMSTQDLADKLCVSRTPVREALLRLQREGLVIMNPKRVTVVSGIDKKRMVQEHFMRKSLELSALELFMANKSFETLKEMNELIHKQAEAGFARKYEELLAYDDAFHRLLFTETSQMLSWTALEEICTHYRRIRLLSLWDSSVAENVVTQHVDLIRAIECDDLVQARGILQQHLEELELQKSGLYQRYPEYFIN